MTVSQLYQGILTCYRERIAQKHTRSYIWPPTRVREVSHLCVYVPVTKNFGQTNDLQEIHLVVGPDFVVHVYTNFLTAVSVWVRGGPLKIREAVQRERWRIGGAEGRLSGS